MTIALRVGVLLFAAATFTSAFLLFLVQPLVAKHIVPWFGGVPSVWSLCLAFYQTTLFAGYAYAHLMVQSVRPTAQFAIHGVLLTAAALALPVLPSDAWKPDGAADPSTTILAMLLVNVALPFLALAATGPLVAAWFARVYPSRSPYPLYAVSNVGSLLALLVYPFLLEPQLALSTTSSIWSGAFVATGAAVIACGFLARSHRAEAPRALASEEEPVRAHVALWILLPACAVVMLMGVTNELCLDVASVPFLWVVPLLIYLTTLILCFSNLPVYRRTPYVVLAALFLLPPLAQSLEIAPATVQMLEHNIPLQVARYGLMLFATCMLMHGELYRLRPPARSLTAFYLCVSAGGALGGLAIGLGAPLAFDGFYELALGGAFCWLLLLAVCRNDPSSRLGPKAPAWRWLPTLAFVAATLYYAGTEVFWRHPRVLHQERSFFGVLRVEERRGGQGLRRALIHGTTLHGEQYVAKPEQPTSYYGMDTAIGIALTRSESDPPAEIGVIGLGAGTLAAYGRAGDHLRFFEIDEAVIRIARDERYFSYLADSPAGISIVEGDGRISLSRERARGAPPLDTLIVDAYSSDAVPVHLLTREALALYLESLEPSGLLAIHVSSRYFDLMPVLSRLAADAGVHAVEVTGIGLPRRLSSGSSWVFLARDEARIRALVGAVEHRHRALRLEHARPIRSPSAEMVARAPLWTDDYSNLFRALSPRRPPTGAR